MFGLSFSNMMAEGGVTDVVPVIYLAVRNAFHWSATATSGIFSVAGLTGAITAPIAGRFLDRLIRCHAGPSASSVLDCACGISTQAIGLAMRGYSVRTTDLSPAAVARAAREAASFGAALTSAVADFCTLKTTMSDPFDVVLCCDNTLAHQLEE